MKTLIYLFFAIIGLICAICSIAILSIHPVNCVQVVGLLSLAVFSMASMMIFGYAFYHQVKENRLYDLAAKEQLENDWYYYELQCNEQLFKVGKESFENMN
ncbi:MAG: hypothetical protein UR43_C0019G0032 [candidate division TM6 bacterium GW2011_GWF2_33_332]|nr:MAG: hypothetical protein UR43_C0019G0032 [candidate division TM6 bacterium GW2011_GWF2_33_332]